MGACLKRRPREHQVRCRRTRDYRTLYGISRARIPTAGQERPIGRARLRSLYRPPAGKRGALLKAACGELANRPSTWSGLGLGLGLGLRLGIGLGSGLGVGLGSGWGRAWRRRAVSAT